MMAEITNSSSPRRIGIDSRKPTSVIPKAALARVPLSHHPAFYGHALSIALPSVKICENGPRRTSRQTHERPGQDEHRGAEGQAGVDDVVIKAETQVFTRLVRYGP